MARKEYERSGSRVPVYRRNGQYVNSYVRKGSIVPASDKISKKQVAENIRRIDEYTTPLFFQTTCYWCPDPVFFYRSEDGGCALFNRPGWPWEVHECWLTHRESLKHKIAKELHEHRFDGHLYSKKRERALKPRNADTLSLDCYVVAKAGKAIQFPSYRGAKTASFFAVRFTPADNSSVFYSIFIPSHLASTFRMYSVYQIDCEYRKYKNRWRCFLTNYQTMGIDQTKSLQADRALALVWNCSVCNSELSKNQWGFGTDYDCECSSCGKMRGTLSSAEFDDFIVSCYKLQRKRLPK